MNIQNAVKAQVLGKTNLAKEILVHISKSASILEADVALKAIAIDLTNFEDSESVLSVIFSKTKLFLLPKEVLNSLNKVFPRPLSIKGYTIGKEKFIVITEDDGLYSIIGSPVLLNKVKNSLLKYSKSSDKEGYLQPLKLKKTVLQQISGV